MRRQAALGWIGILLACMIWVASVLALAYAMDHLERASSLLHTHPVRGIPVKESSSDLLALLWSFVFTLLQLASFLLSAFVFRAFWRMRSAVCFSLAAGLVIAGHAAALLALLIWLGLTPGAG